MKVKAIILFLLVILSIGNTYGQEEEELSDPDSSGVVNNRLLPVSTPVLLFSDPEDESKEKEKKKKKKIRKNVYFGEKTKKNVIRSSFRDQVTYQVFHFTLKDRLVDPYIRDIYWYDPKSKAIKNKGYAASKGYLLHGPYERRVGDNVVETGMYFYGTKHGRWMAYDGNNILVDKAHYSQGWPKDSRVTYYNRADKQIEKLTPVEYDLKEGNFFHLYQDGQVAVTGEYRFGEKVGLWTEYWPSKDDQTVRKREIQYQANPFTSNFRPYIRAEWDKEGNLIYRNDI
jgi:antitoxin component YwqK of YwqJK toxin-antitoxin module